MTSISSVANTSNILNISAKKSENASVDSITTSNNESSKVTLSDDAKVLARFASKGIAVAMKEFDKPISASSSNNSYGSMVTDKSISKDDFMNLLDTLGVNEADRDKFMSGFDSNADGTISHDEILKVFAGTSNEDNSLSQAVIGLMDKSGNGDGRVDAREFAKITTKFYDAEK
jgi:Ca2+-binding EF-hand superfamily protein